MNRPGNLRPSILAGPLAALLMFFAGERAMQAATPYTEATVTRVQNKVNYGEQRGGQSVTRPAAPEDVVRARNFLLSENNSRAELQYPDGTIVRIGQNTVFSFEAETRTLSLTKGSFIFYVPKGQAGGTIKTPSLTAAITGTCGFAAADGSTEKIGFVEGSGKLIPSGKPVLTNQFAWKTGNGPIIVDALKGVPTSGALWTFNGPLPPFRELLLTLEKIPDLSILTLQETLERTANGPGAQGIFFPVKEDNKKSDDNGGGPKFIPITPKPVIIATPRPVPPIDSE